MSDDIVILRKYVNEFEARLLAAVLEANGISVQVFSDTVGGAYPMARLLRRPPSFDLHVIRPAGAGELGHPGARRRLRRGEDHRSAA